MITEALSHPCAAGSFSIDKGPEPVLRLAKDEGETTTRVVVLNLRSRIVSID